MFSFPKLSNTISIKSIACIFMDCKVVIQEMHSEITSTRAQTFRIPEIATVDRVFGR